MDGHVMGTADHREFVRSLRAGETGGTRGEETP
jgi:hypothetical protein